MIVLILAQQCFKFPHNFSFLFSSPSSQVFAVVFFPRKFVRLLPHQKILLSNILICTRSISSRTALFQIIVLLYSGKIELFILSASRSLICVGWLTGYLFCMDMGAQGTSLQHAWFPKQVIKISAYISIRMKLFSKFSICSKMRGTIASLHIISSFCFFSVVKILCMFLCCLQ